MTSNPFHVAVCQIPNTPHIAANAARILAYAADLASDHDLIVFPECALTGFSARRPESLPDHLPDFLEAATRIARTQRCALLVPTILPIPDSEHLTNAAFLIQPDHPHRTFTKEGLTPSETQFFEPGAPSSRTFTLGDTTIGLLFCMEAALDPWRWLDPLDPPDIILWPAYWGWDDPFVWDERIAGMGQRVHQNTRAWGRPLLQANFAFNGPDDQRQAGPNGGSVLIDGAGEHVASAARAREAILSVTLGIEALQARPIVRQV